MKRSFPGSQWAPPFLISHNNEASVLFPFVSTERRCRAEFSPEQDCGVLCAASPHSSGTPSRPPPTETVGRGGLNDWDYTGTGVPSYIGTSFP